MKLLVAVEVLDLVVVVMAEQIAQCMKNKRVVEHMALIVMQFIVIDKNLP